MMHGTTNNTKKNSTFVCFQDIKVSYT